VKNPLTNGNHDKNYSLWDIYPHADFVTYPSLYEGFGNAFLEAIYFKKPLLVNRYPIFVRDIEPKGFDLVVMDGFLSKKAVQKVSEIFASRERRERMVNNNFEIARQYYSYSVLHNQLSTIMNQFFGQPQQQLSSKSSDQQHVIYLEIDQLPSQHDQLNNNISEYMS
jgi:glycosyltransferase involved in cell wall biosynthesis